MKSPVDFMASMLTEFIERTGARAEAPILWPPDEKPDSLEKTVMLGKTEGRRRGRQRTR